jgi:hypothetical protein
MGQVSVCQYRLLVTLALESVSSCYLGSKLKCFDEILDDVQAQHGRRQWGPENV